MDVAVCIPSIGRTSVVQTVQSILNQKQPQDIKTKVIVADDSRGGLARRIMTAAFADAILRGDVVIVESNRQNIAEARNKCLDAVGDVDYIAFIDDDEYAATDWIAACLEEFEASGNDVLFGKVTAIFDADVPSYFHASGIYSFDPDDHKGRLVTGATSNVMFKRSLLVAHGVTFQKKYGTTGGEDTVFFNTLYRLGAKLGGASKAVVYENVSQARCDFAYLKRRYMRNGQTQSLLLLTDTPFRRSSQVMIAMGKLVVLFALCVVSKIFAKRKYVDYFTRYWQNVGRINFVLGENMPELYSS